MKKFCFSLVAIICFLTACGQNNRQQLTLKTPVQNISAQQQQDDKLAKDIGEMLLVGFRGTTIDRNSHIVRDIKEYHVGSVILFEYDAPSRKHKRNIENPAQLKKLCKELQSLSDTPLLIGVDQEGGMVNRLKPSYGFPTILSAQAMAEKGMDTVAHYAQLTATMLRDAGINLDFAPCADLNVNPQCPIIGKLGRSFSNKSETVSQCCTIWLEALTKQHIVGCLKHFPGHGSAQGDTHLGLVDVSNSWTSAELEPYKQILSSTKVPMIMIAHLLIKQLDEDNPTSLSPMVIDQMVRTDLHYDGVIVTDDLAMGAITKQYGYEQAILKALQAGVDMLCISNNGQSYDSEIVPKTVKIINEYIEKGMLDPDKIHKSAERIRKMKKEFCK